MEDSLTSREFMNMVATKMNKKPEDVEKFTLKLEEAWIGTVGDLRLMDEDTWK